MLTSIKQKIAQVLRIGTRVTRTDMSYLVRGNFWLGIGTAVSSLLSFILVIAFGNLISPEVYGTYRFVLSFASMLALAGLSGFASATVRAVAKGFEGEFMRSFKIQILSSTLGSLAAFIIAFYYYWNGNLLLTKSFITLGLALPFIESLVLYNALLIGRKEFKKSTIVDIIAQVIATGLLLIAIYLKLGVVGLLATYFGSWIFVRLFFFLYIYKTSRPNDLKDQGTIKLGAHLSAMGFLNYLATYLDKIIVFHFGGAADVAIYSFAIAPVEQTKGFLKNINILATPKFSERSEEDLKKTMLKKMGLMAIFILLIVAVYMLAAPWLFKVFLPKYQSSVFLSQIFMLSLLGTTANLPISAMKSQAKVKGLYFSNIVSSIVIITLIVILTPLYGIMGTILARLISRILGIFISLIAFYYF